MGSSKVGIALSLLLGACSGDSPPGGGSSSGGAPALGGSAGAAVAGGIGGTAVAGAGGSSTGAPGTGGAGMGGAVNAGGSSDGPMTGGAGGDTAGGASGSANGGASGALEGGASGSASGGASGAPEGGNGGNAGGAAGTGAGNGGGGTDGGGSGGGTGAGCTRELLKSALEAYFEALAARDPSTLPLSDTVKFTENGEELELGTAGLWKGAGEVKHTQSAFDTEACMVATQAVVPEGTMDIPLAVRLKLEEQTITEIETIAVRPGDYALASSNPQAIIDVADDVGWEEPVPEAQRNSREAIIAWMDKYFRMFPAGVCNVSNTCRRYENGGGNFACTAGASCNAGQPGPGDANMVPRLILADEETGIGVGFTLFLGQYTDMHMFKMYGDQVHAVHAILGEAESSGWD